MVGMNELKTGQFYGETSETIFLDGITLTDTEYTKAQVDWHYHQNAYFTFILQGKLIEGNRKETYDCSAGSLLYHNWQEPHYNIKPAGFTRGFHIEVNQEWINNYYIDTKELQGSMMVWDPRLKLLLYKIYKETKIKDRTSSIAIQTLLLETFSLLKSDRVLISSKKPSWVYKVHEILKEKSSERLSLNELSGLLRIHPVHLSRDFPRHFHCSLGDYIRKIKIEKSLSLLTTKRYSLTQIAFECGFSDQSHFIRCFRDATGINPLAYRKLFD
jgi:AraC-like DNA-binding protein